MKCRLSSLAKAVGSGLAATFAIIRPSRSECAIERAMARLDRVTDEIIAKAPRECVFDDVVDRL